MTDVKSMMGERAPAECAKSAQRGSAAVSVRRHLAWRLTQVSFESGSFPLYSFLLLKPECLKSLRRYLLEQRFVGVIAAVNT